jgi:hypothetical protein
VTFAQTAKHQYSISVPYLAPTFANHPGFFLIQEFKIRLSWGLCGRGVKEEHSKFQGLLPPGGAVSSVAMGPT